MIRTNLATRPFYNERRTYAILATAALVVVAITVFNISTIVTLTRRQGALSTAAADAESTAERMRAEAADLRRSVNPQELEKISSEAREANGIIDRRLFSWTELFNRFESTLPPNVRIVSVRPRVEKDGSIIMTLSVVAKQVEDIASFIEELEGAHAFANLLSREESLDENGMLRATLEGRYVPAPAPAGPTGATQ